MNILTRLAGRPAAVAEPARPATRTPVASKHIPFVEAIWLRLEAARAQLAKKEAYLHATADAGLRVAARDQVAEAADRDALAIDLATDALERIKQLLAAGAEPTAPPDRWYCGLLAEPDVEPDRWGDRDFPQETWPSLTRYRTVMVFQGAMPVAAIQRLAATQDLVDDVRVYSPREDDFRRLPEPQLRDPVIIGSIDFLGDPHYFEIARWDIDADLAAVFGSLGHEAVS